MIPWFKNQDLQLFYKYLENCTVYFEFGSGGSTYQAAQKSNIKKIYSVESDKSWHEKIKSKIVDKDNKIEYMFVDMKSAPNNWGNPGSGSNQIQWIEYSESD